MLSHELLQLALEFLRRRWSVKNWFLHNVKTKRGLTKFRNSLVSTCNASRAADSHACCQRSNLSLFLANSMDEPMCRPESNALTPSCVHSTRHGRFAAHKLTLEQMQLLSLPRTSREKSFDGRGGL